MSAPLPESERAPIRAYDRTVALAIAAVAALGAIEIAAATLLHLGRAWGW